MAFPRSPSTHPLFRFTTHPLARLPTHPFPPSKSLSKRRRTSTREPLTSDNELSRLLHDAFKSQHSARNVVLHLIDKYKFSPSALWSKLEAKRLEVSFSKVTYGQIAPLVGLNPQLALRDAPTFRVHRARIPTELFRGIVQDLHIALKQYGTPIRHRTEEARSRFLAPLFNRTVAQFNSLITNYPESMILGCLTTKGRIEYHFKICEALTVLFIEVKQTLGTPTERLDAIAQVIAEADACDFANSNIDFRIPITAILCDGNSFEFFRFQFTSLPTFSRGFLPSPSAHRIFRLNIAEFHASSLTEYLRSLRPVCETLFDALLDGYCAGIAAYRAKSEASAEMEGRARESTPAWVAAAQHAHSALELAREAAERAARGERDDADLIVEDAFVELKKSVESAPPEYRPDDADVQIMDGWVDGDMG